MAVLPLLRQASGEGGAEMKCAPTYAPVWEVLLDSAWQTIEPPEVRAKLTAAFQRGACSCQFSSVRGTVVFDYDVDFKTMVQKNLNNGTQRQMRNNAAATPVKEAHAEGPPSPLCRTASASNWDVLLDSAWQRVEPSEVQTKLSQAFARGDGTCRFTCRRGSVDFEYEVDFETMSQKNLTNGTQRLIRHNAKVVPPKAISPRVDAVNNPIFASVATWEILVDSGWLKMEPPDVHATLSAALQQGHATYRYKSLRGNVEFEYEVDLNSMMQTNLSNGTQRLLRCSGMEVSPPKASPPKAISPQADAADNPVLTPVTTWEILLESGWLPMEPPDVYATLSAALRQGHATCRYKSVRGSVEFEYEVDFKGMMQTNLSNGTKRQVKHNCLREPDNVEALALPKPKKRCLARVEQHCCWQCQETGGARHDPLCVGIAAVAPGLVQASPAPINAAGAGANMLFMCCQLTPCAVQRVEAWFGPRAPISVKASLPKFNVKTSDAWGLARILPFDVPCFGPLVTRAVLDIFNNSLVRQTASDFHVQVPEYTLNRIVQERVCRVRSLIAEATKLACDSSAISKLSQFVDAIEKLTPSHFSSPDDWTSFVNRFCLPGWENKLHHDDVLSNFGFPEREIHALKSQPQLQNAFRWLAKAFDCFGLPGSLSDVVNLVYAMMGHEPGKPSAHEVVQVLREFNSRFCNEEWDKLWVPTHMIHDAEFDDVAAWLLLASVHSRRRSKFEVLIQLPVGDAFTVLQGKFQAMTVAPNTMQVFRDTGSTNGANVQEAGALFSITRKR